MDEVIPQCFLSISTTINLGIEFWIGLIVLLVLLMASALISGSEVAFFSLSPEEKEILKEDGDEKAKKSIQLLNQPKDLLATILISNNFVNVGIVIIASFLFNKIYPKNPSIEGIDYVRGIVEIGGITFVLLLIGELIPKVYANHNSMRLVELMTTPLIVIQKIPPFSWIRIFIVQGTEGILKTAKKKELDVSTDDLENAIELTREKDATPEEQKILEGIVNFGNTDVRQIMCSRVDTVAVDEDLNYEELMEVILSSGFSRIPVYKDSFDNVTGILFVKDLLAYINKSSDFKWNTIIRKPFFVPENKKIDDLLKEFQEKHIHMAVVVDEYGGSSGVVTLEDVMEEIIGEITDEFDDDDVIYTKIDENSYLFEGKTSLVDFYKVLEIDGKLFEEAKGESDSIGGFLIEHSGKILKNNENYIFDNIEFIVQSSDKKRVKLIKVIKLDENEAKEK